MRVLILTIVIGFCLNQSLSCQTSNNIGIDFGGYVVGTPKHTLTGDKYNTFMKSSSSIVGFFYERFLGDSPYSIKSGVYLNKQFNSVVSFYIPIEFNGNILGKRNESGLFLGYTGGINLNFIREVVYGFRIPEPNTSSDIFINKDSYISPHFGLNTGINFKRICISFSGLFHFLIPEFVKYETKYVVNSNFVTEYNTNKSIGVSFRAGLSYRF